MTSGLTFKYPAEQAVDIALRDGSTVHVRPVRASDRARLAQFLGSLSDESLYLRVCGFPNIDQLARWSADVDYRNRYGVLATLGSDHRVVAHAAYIRTGPGSAEVAFEVSDEMHGHGLGTALLAQLAGVARRRGIRRLTAVVMPSNRRMIDVFRHSGFPCSVDYRAGLTEVKLETELSDEVLTAFDTRSHTAAVGAVASFLTPSSVAVVGIADDPEDRGAGVLRRLVAGGFAGPVYAVGRGTSVDGRPIRRSLSDVPAEVELAVLVAPPEDLVAAAQECADAGVRAVLVLGGTVATVDCRRVDCRDQLLDVCRDAGMRMIGPRSYGIIGRGPEGTLSAAGTGESPAGGRVALLAQGSGVASALLKASARAQLGLSGFVSLGDKADISGNDLLDYWASDSETTAILLYLESFGNPRRFVRIARRVTRDKPILAVKSGRTPIAVGGSRSPALTALAASDLTVDTLFEQAGVIRADSIGDLLAAGVLLASQRPPRGDRVAIVSNSAGAAAVGADACLAGGLTTPRPSRWLARRFEPLVVPDRPAANPLQLSAEASAADYRRAVDLLASSGEYDAVVAVVADTGNTQCEQIAAGIDAGGLSAEVTLALVVMDGAIDTCRGEDADGVQRFAFPENAARALGLLAAWNRLRSRPLGRLPILSGSDREAAAAMIEKSLRQADGWLRPGDCELLLSCYGIAMGAGSGLELALAAIQDPNFGPLLVCSTGSGSQRGDVAVRILPITDTDAGQMVKQLAVRRVIDSSGQDALADALLRLGALVDHHPEIAELDVSAVLTEHAGVQVGRARIRVRPPSPPAPLGALPR